MMIEQKISYLTALRVWWHFMWRFVVFGVLAGVVLGFVIGVAYGLLGKGEDAPATAMLVSFFFSLFVQIWVVRRVINKKWRIGSYRLALVKDFGV